MNRAPGSRGTGTFQGWQILATGQTAPQGSDKLNIARQSGGVSQISSKDVFTITSDGKVGIGTTSPASMLEIDAPNQAGLRITGPAAGGVGAGIQLSAINPGNGWEILATGGAAAQGPEDSTSVILIRLKIFSPSRGLRSLGVGMLSA
jgi:hypothetical protein